MRPDLEEAAVRRYLLGLSSEAESKAVEQAYLADPQALERVRGLEDDLLDDYAACRLGPEERRAFETRYFASPVLRARVDAARALRLAAPPARPESVPVAAPRPARWRVPVVIAAGLVVAAVVSGVWPPRSGEVTTPGSPPTTIARSESPAPPEASPTSVPTTTGVVLALSPVLLRGEGAPSQLRVPRGTATVELKLEGDAALMPATPADLAIDVRTAEGRPVWKGAAVRRHDAKHAAMVASADVPSAKLLPGDYVVTLSTAGARPRTLHRYYLRVLR